MVRKVLICIVAGVLLIALAVGGFLLYGNYQMAKLPALTAMEALNYTLDSNDRGVITVGTIHHGTMDVHIYGRDGKELPTELRTYEIGSLTKTFTAALICQAVQEGRISLDATINTYLPLPQKEHYPTVRELLTHTSGYKGFYFETPMISNFLSRRNDFYGITKEMVLDQLGKVKVSEKKHGFAYSNFGYATLGLILEEIYNVPYTELVEGYIRTLGLENTCISNGEHDKAWDWKSTDAYMAAGALTSNVEDMLSYAESLLTGNPALESLKEVNATPAQYEALRMRVDEIAYGWILDNENGFIWHNGGTGDYNCYLGLDMENGNAVVVLSNLPPSYRIPATVIGVKVLEEMRSVTMIHHRR